MASAILGRALGWALHGARAAIVLTATNAALATPLSLTGEFMRDDDRFTYEFDVLRASMISIRTLSWGGGTNAAGALIAPGGFAPVVALFRRSNAPMLVALASPAVSVALCGPGANVDPISGFCWDVSLDQGQLSLTAGEYAIVLTQDDNLPQSDDHRAPFSRDGQSDFTGPTFLGIPGQFIAAGGFQRDGHFAIDIDLHQASVPSPGSALLIGLGLAGLAYRARRDPSFNATHRNS